MHYLYLRFVIFFPVPYVRCSDMDKERLDMETKHSKTCVASKCSQPVITVLTVYIQLINRKVLKY